MPGALLGHGAACRGPSASSAEDARLSSREAYSLRTSLRLAVPQPHLADRSLFVKNPTVPGARGTESPRGCDFGPVPLTPASLPPPPCWTHPCVRVVLTRLHSRRPGRRSARARTLRGGPGPSCGLALGSPSPRSTSRRRDGAGLTSFPGDKATTRVPSRGPASTSRSLLAAPALGQHPLGRTPALPRDRVAGSICGPGARGLPRPLLPRSSPDGRPAPAGLACLHRVIGAWEGRALGGTCWPCSQWAGRRKAPPRPVSRPAARGSEAYQVELGGTLSGRWEGGGSGSRAVDACPG